MKKNSLISNKGLSLSQAQSISNLCYQRALEIDNKLSKVNNASKSVTVVINGNAEKHATVTPQPMPDNVVELLLEKSKLHACQAFLMENIKAKDAMLTNAKKMAADLSLVVIPNRDDFKAVVPKTLPEVGEDWGWEQLTVSEINEHTEAVAFASHVGTFIHERSILDKLRKELPNIPAIEWMSIKDGEKTPVIINVHHTPEQLHKLHEELAGLHRTYEQKVNYFEAKVKNLVTAENARIARLNSDAQNEARKLNNDILVAFESANKKATEEIRSIQADFENKRQKMIMEIAQMRINIDPRFQETINMFLKQISDKQE